MQNHHRPASAMVLAALGIVYGDIGTSPLYTLKETFLSSHLQVGETGVLGFVSLISWALILVVTLKYVVFILHADNKGEGGVVVLMQLALQYLQGCFANRTRWCAAAEQHDWHPAVSHRRRSTTHKGCSSVPDRKSQQPPHPEKLPRLGSQRNL